MIYAALHNIYVLDIYMTHKPRAFDTVKLKAAVTAMVRIRLKSALAFPHNLTIARKGTFAAEAGTSTMRERDPLATPASLRQVIQVIIRKVSQ